MNRKIALLIILVLILAACNLFNTAVPASTPGNPTETTTNTPTYTTTLIGTITRLLPSSTPSATPTIPLVGTVAQPPIPPVSTYVDDRSTASQIIISFYNAINRQEYSRAYGYWTDPSTMVGDFSDFVNGYANTISVDLVFGQITGEGGMSQAYYTVPVLLKASEANGVQTNYAACYVVHQSSPDVFGEPPFQPMSISRGTAKISPAGSSITSALADACVEYPTGSVEVPASAGSLDVDKNNYIDNRSGPLETVSSLLNAINSKQYVRAFSYFQNPAAFPGDFAAYAAGYENTEAVTVTFGTSRNEGAAGSLYYQIPLAMKVLTSTNTTETFVVCYTLRLGQPAMQSEPPFQPMGITDGKFTQVNNNADIASLLAIACQ